MEAKASWAGIVAAGPKAKAAAAAAAVLPATAHHETQPVVQAVQCPPPFIYLGGGDGVRIIPHPQHIFSKLSSGSFRANVMFCRR
jgi:hypothetical protein